MLRLLIFVLLIFSLATSFSLTPQQDCSILHNGTFLYDGIEEKNIVVKIDGNKHLEIHNNGKYKIESQLEWVSDCEYNMTMLKNTVPNFPFHAGDIMNVKVNKVEGNKIFYTAKVNDKSFDGILKKIKK